MVRSHLSSAARWLKNACLLQGIMLLAGMPILAAWGLPISLASIAGNLLHNIFLIVFLLLCSMLFFASLLQVPTGLLVDALTQVHRLWSWVLAYSSPIWLSAITVSATLLLFGSLCIASVIAFWRTKKRLSYVLFCGGIILLISGTLHWQRPLESSTVRRGARALSCVPHADGSIVLYDHGLLTGKNNEEIFAYTVLPHLRYHYGNAPVSLHRSNRRHAQVQRMLQAACPYKI